MHRRVIPWTVTALAVLLLPAHLPAAVSEWTPEVARVDDLLQKGKWCRQGAYVVSE